MHVCGAVEEALEGIVVHRILADRAVLDVAPGGLALVELAPGYTVSDIRACTEPQLRA